MNNYEFYFDESFHTRTITKESLKDTNYFNSYISTGLGFAKKNKHNILKKYGEFENRYKQIFTVDELKSEIIKAKNYKNGLASFNKNAIKLYSDYFNLLNEEEIIYYISITDKVEYLLINCSYDVPPFMNIKATIYSIVKIINVYKPQNVIEDIMNKSDNLLEDLIVFFEKQIKINGDIELKKMENMAMLNAIRFLKNIDTSTIDYNFDYSFAYKGFKKLIKELKVNNVSVIIDKEGSNKIVKCAKKEGFLDSKQMDSKNSIGVRMSDMFCGFISRIMRALYNSTYHDPEILYKERHLIPKEWYNLNQDKFSLYKEIARFIKKYIDVYYGTYASLYSDLFSEFIGLIYYFDKFSSYEEYSKTSIEQHFEDCNNSIISRIAHDIERIEKSY